MLPLLLWTAISAPPAAFVGELSRSHIGGRVVGMTGEIVCTAEQCIGKRVTYWRRCEEMGGVFQALVLSRSLDIDRGDVSFELAIFGS